MTSNNSPFKVITLNVGGINENPFEYYDVFVKNASNATKTPIEKFSHQMKKEIAKFIRSDLNENTSLNYLNGVIPSFPIGTKNRTQMNSVQPILTNIWFGAKELDRIFATSGFGPGKDKLNQYRFNIIYNPDGVFRNLGIDNFGDFMNAWLGYFTPSDFPTNQPKNLETIVAYLLSKDKEGKNKKFIIPQNLEGLIFFDFLLFNAFKNSGLSREHFDEIKDRSQFLNNLAKVSFVNAILQSGIYQIIFLQEVDLQMNFELNSNNGLRYTQFGNQGSVIFVKNDDNMPRFVKTSVNTSKNMGKICNNIVKESKEIISIFSEEANFLLVSAHLASKQKEALPQLNKLITKINNFISTTGASFIMGIDSNIDAYDEEDPKPMNTLLPEGIHSSSDSKPTSRKTRTWLQTQMDKADVAKNKCIDYIITNHNIGRTKVISKSTTVNGKITIANGNNANNSSVLTPNRNWPFDHFAVSAEIIFNNLNNPQEKIEAASVSNVEKAGGAKKRKYKSKAKKNKKSTKSKTKKSTKSKKSKK